MPSPRILLYGLSARGLAINTAEPSGEEFPAFTHFWIERPGAKRIAIVIYALLESESTTGAYRFTVPPGVETLTDVELTLFPRAEMRVVGIAPLTSMFLFDETNRGRLDDYRPEVHDSDGLQITTQSGEQIFRPARESDQAAGIHLHHQRRRVSVWCSVRGNKAIFKISTRSMSAGPAPGSSPRVTGAPGAVELVEIPSGRETQRQHRGILAPGATADAGHPAQFAYRIIWCAEPPLPKGLGKDGRHPLRRQHRRQAARFLAGFRRRRRKDRRLATGSGRLRRQDLQRHADVQQRVARSARQLRNRSHDAELIELRLRIMRGDTPGHRNMAVPMDLQLNAADAFERAGAPRAACRRRRRWTCRRRICATSPGGAERRGFARAVLYARFILIAVTFGVTTYGVYQMLQVVRFASMTLLQGTMIFFFAVSLGWIAFAAGSVLAGASKRRDPSAPGRDRAPADGAGDAHLQ